jgi:putative acetyltransferase
MNEIRTRNSTPQDRPAIARLLDAAFGQPDEGRLVEALVAGDHAVLERVAESDDGIAGHILFSRLMVAEGDKSFSAVALAPVAVQPGLQRRGIGTRLIEDAHARLAANGEALSVVLGAPAYYGRFGYERQRAAGFDSDYQGDYLQALAWREAPATGRLVYAPPFAAL